MKKINLWYCNKHRCYHEIGEWFDCTIEISQELNKIIFIH